MKQTFLLVLVVLLCLGILGCEKKTTEVVSPETLSPPVGLKSITGDKEITLLWYASNYESDFNGYKIYMDTLYSGTTTPEEIPSGFTEITFLPKDTPCYTLQSYPRYNLKNGTTYYFLVVATNEKNEISRPSNIINDTPRPETGTEYAIISSYDLSETECGYELATFSVTDMTGINTSDYSTPSGLGDFICERMDFPGGVGDRLWLAGTNKGGIMDLGFMSDWDDADMAPETGYAPTGYSLYAIEGHVYAIKTGDNHYGKIQIMDLDVGAAWLSFKACYQTKKEERQYKIRP